MGLTDFDETQEGFGTKANVEDDSSLKAGEDLDLSVPFLQLPQACRKFLCPSAR